MFATKMVCFIQKLLGRDDDTTTDETSDDETLSLDGQENSRKRQTASDDTGHCCIVPHDEQLRRRRTSSDVSRSSGCSHSTTELLETGKFWCKDGFVHREQLMQQFGKQDSDFAGSRLSTCELLSSSHELAPSSEYHPQCRSSSDDAAGDAEPVCCCDTCTLFLSLNSSHRENQPILPPLADEHNASNVPTAPSPCHQLSSGGLLLQVHPRFCLPSSMVPVTFASLVHGKSSSTQTVGSTIKEVLHFDEMLCHEAEKELDTQNLPPMISVSPDGEEGFAVSQRVLQNIRNKPFSEVPPNKTICHIQYKFVNSK